jgi:hypothetical protein
VERGDGKELFTVGPQNGTGNDGTSVAFSPDAKTIAVGDSGDNVNPWTAR